MFIIIIIFKIIIFFYIQIHYKMSRVLEIGYFLSVNALYINRQKQQVKTFFGDDIPLVFPLHKLARQLTFIVNG